MKSRRVSWASGVNLCQVVSFLSEDSPSQVGLTIRNNFQSMKSKSAFSSSAILKKLSCSGDRNLTNQSQQNVSNITRVRWTCPPNYTVSCDWHVAAGEESQEAGTQKLRELNVLEAVYPRVSAIPFSPAVSTCTERESYDDSLTSDIPIVPVEEMENNPDLEPTPRTLNAETPKVTKQQVPSTPAMDADILAAASAACAALLKSSEKESMIDPDLLIKIFNDPNLIEQLLKGGVCPAVGKVITSNPIPQTLQVPSSCPVVFPPNLVANVLSDHPFSSPSPQSVHVPSPGQTVTSSLPSAIGFTRPIDHFGTTSASAPIMSSGHLFGPSAHLDTVTQPFENHPLIPHPIQPPIQVASLSSFAMPLPQPQELLKKVTQSSFPSDNTHQPVSDISGKVDTWSSIPKDMIYLKNLIREHGWQKQGKVGLNLITSHQNDSVNLKIGNPLIQEQMNYKNSRKSCMFFNSPQGCYSGYTCPFQHDIGPCWDDGRNAKRAKLGLIP